MPESKNSDQKEIRKTKFWTRRALSAISEMRHNKMTGLFPKSEGWRNVVEHELVEAEAVDVLAEKLGISEEDRKNLRTAAFLHDVFKRKEIEKAKKEGSQSFDSTAVEQANWVRSLGYPEKIIELIESVAHTSLEEFNGNFDNISTARKIMHYVDDITLDNDIVDLDRRIDYLETKPEYKDLNERGKAIFNGRTYFEVQREISKKIEAEFAPRLGISDPSAIPAFIKDNISFRIDQSE